MSDINSLPSPDNPEEALAAVVALRVVAQNLERSAVKKAIEQGWSWSQIAEAFKHSIMFQLPPNKLFVLSCSVITIYMYTM